MEEEFERESESTQTEQITSVEEEKQTLDSLPRIEELRKSEQEVKIDTKIEGVTQVEQKTKTEDRFFTKKTDEKKVYLKKRLKIVTSVYVSVVALLLTFVGINIATLAMLKKDINSNTQTIQAEQAMIEELKNNASQNPPMEELQISLNEPRDYSEDKQELTFLDKLTILFRNLFG